MKTLQPLSSQIEVCEKYRTQPQLFLLHDRVGISLATMNQVPINGLRIPAMSGSSGWFIYGGDEPTDDPNFYQPLCITHLRNHCEIAIPYLCLPAGWRFQIDRDGYEDVWYDESLLTGSR
jgi:hypothetical protein